MRALAKAHFLLQMEVPVTGRSSWQSLRWEVPGGCAPTLLEKISMFLDPLTFAVPRRVALAGGGRAPLLRKMHTQ